MRQNIKLNKVLLIAAVILLVGGTASAQMNQRPKRLSVPNAVIRGYIGGESQDRYVVRARRGQTLTIRFSWRREGDNRSDFSVLRGRNFDNAETVKFGRESNGGKTWTGKIPATGDYFIMVTAYPTAHYTMRVAVR